MKEKIFKKGLKKRLLSLVLALVMVFSLVPSNIARAATNTKTFGNYLITPIIFDNFGGTHLVAEDDGGELEFDETGFKNALGFDTQVPSKVLYSVGIQSFTDQWGSRVSFAICKANSRTLEDHAGEQTGETCTYCGQALGSSGPEVIEPSSLAVAVTLPTTGSSISGEGELFPGATFSYNTDLVNSVQSAYGFFSDYENEVIATTIEAGSTYTVYIGLQARNESEHPFTEEIKNLTEEETKAYFSSLPSEFTFVSGTLRRARFVAIFTYTVGNPGGGSNPEPKPTPSKSEAAAAPTIPTDYVAERVAEEEAMDVTLVTIDTTQYSKNEETVVPGTSYNLSKFITTKGIVKGIKTAVVAANNAKKDTVEIYTGKPFCFNKEIIKTIQESKKTVVYYFQYKGHIYSVTVPATVDASKVLEKAGFAGPLYVGQQLGTTKLVK